MIHNNTHKSISYHLTVKEDEWVVRCVMLLFNARLLTGHSGSLIAPVVRKVQKRRPVLKKAIKAARMMLREYHTVQLVSLIAKEV